MTFDWLIVGAGYAGSVMAERIASVRNQSVLLIDRRDHIAGNAFDTLDPHGVLIHRYGPHVFHTNSVRVWDYLSQFTEWRPYQHRALGLVDGQLIPVPFNLQSLRQLWPPDAAAALQARLIAEYGMDVKVPILRMLEHPDPEIQHLARFIYDNVFAGYTRKQWDLEPRQLDPSVMARVPVHVSEDDRYFQDRFQALPRDGYTAMFQRMLSHPNIQLRLNTDYRALPPGLEWRRMVYTGPVDEFFEHRHGRLPYRSLRFEFPHVPAAQHQPCGQVNYPNTELFTRVSEFKHMTGQEIAGTTLAVEYPQPHEPGCNEPYYPVPRPESAVIHEKYQAEVAALSGTTIFIGRLADYRYYNMDQVVARALKVFEDSVEPLDRD
ncbi:UDP-galactopyranose mutase [Paludibaculum fermentans]|uniref:UDP-galactopyranose mutase n=1 Tax=Paludibaculum fermentans TaxID=1473598 RepID=A0A7S7SHQ0_PALFE|nr:UDP-galactopyranose mutase [Paludibaculum fermentans]QOY85209.1 UDP-galactopyranose mutase [Paludibaculum fermentans]